MVSYNQSQYYNQQKANKQHQHHFLAVKRPVAPPAQPSKPSKKPPVTRQRPTTRVHIVEPIHFKELVQSLTSAWTQPQPQQSSSPERDRRPQSNAPPPLQLQGGHPTVDSREASSKSTTALLGDGDHYGFNSVGEFGATTELTLSPNFHAFMGSFPMLSPGPLSHFGS